LSQALYEVCCAGTKHKIHFIGSQVHLLDHIERGKAQQTPDAFLTSDEAMVLKAIEALPPGERQEAAKILVESMDVDASVGCYLIGACIEAYGPNLFGFESDKFRRIC